MTIMVHRCMVFAVVALNTLSCREDSVVPDTTSPDPVRDLEVCSSTDSSVTLSWRTPCCEPAHEVLFSTDLLALLTTGGRERATVEPFGPGLENGLYPGFYCPGRCYTVPGLSERTTYYFALRSIDAAGNVSELGNIASGTTLEKPPQFLSEWGSLGSEARRSEYECTIAVSGLVNEIFVADAANDRILVFGHSNSGYTLLRQWGSRCFLHTGEGCVDPDGTGPLELGDGQFAHPQAIAVDRYANVYVTDGNGRLQIFDRSGRFIAKWSTWARDLAVDYAGNVYRASSADGAVMFDSSGNLRTRFGWCAESIAVDAFGNVYTYCESEGLVRMFTRDAALLSAWRSRSGSHNRVSIEVDEMGDIYLAYHFMNRVEKYTNEGTFLSAWGSPGPEEDQSAYATDLTLVSGPRCTQVSYGRFDYIWVLFTSEDRARIQEFQSYSPCR